MQEIENPMRILTSIVLAEGLSLKMVPIRRPGDVLALTYAKSEGILHLHYA